MTNIRKSKNAIKLSRPSEWWGSLWREGLPTGNGIIGASVYGGAGVETIMLTHADLWWQGHVGVLQDVADKLPLLRKQLDDNKFRESENLMQNALIQKGYRPTMSCPLPVCDLKIVQPFDRAIKDYSRTLNMENGEVIVRFKDSASTYDRSLFVSRTQDLICYEITKTGAKTINVDLSFEMHDKFYARTAKAISKLPSAVSIKYEDYFMYFSAQSDNGTEYGAVAKILYYGGKQVVKPNNGGIAIKDTDRVLVIVKLFIESSREKEWKALKPILAAQKLTYDKLMKEHAAVHSKLFLASELDLQADDRDEFCDRLLRHAQQTGVVSNALIEKLYGYGRFLFITSTKPDAKPMSPCGIWAGDYKTENSHITTDSMFNQYSHAMSGGLAEYMNSVFDYYEGHIDDLKKNASRLYGCRGVFVPFCVGLGTGLVGSIDSGVLHNISCGGQVASLFYDYYLYTGDKKFLKERAMPFMREVGVFYEEYLKVKADGLYESSPSYSPNTTPTNYEATGELAIARNSTVDFAVIRELFLNLIKGSNLTKLYPHEVAKWKDMLTRIPKEQLNNDNTIKEYIDAKLQDNQTSPSTALFFNVYPGNLVDRYNPQMQELAKSYYNTIKKRAISSIPNTNSIDLIKAGLVFARLQDGQNAYEQVAHAVRNMTMNNLVFAKNDWRGMGVGTIDNWASYTTEPNNLIVACTQEMILQSNEDTIVVLPALPAEFGKGEMQGLTTKFGAECSLEWDIKKGSVVLKIRARQSQKISIRLPDFVKKVKANCGEKVDYVNHVLTNLELSSGKVVVVDMR